MSILSMFLLSCTMHYTAAPMQDAQVSKALKSQVTYQRADVAKFTVAYQNEEQPPSSDCFISLTGSTSQNEGASEVSWNWRLRVSTSEGPSSVRSRNSSVAQQRPSARATEERSLNLTERESKSIIHMLSNDFHPESAFGLSNLSSGAVLNWRSGRGAYGVRINFTLGTDAKWTHETTLFGSVIDKDSEEKLTKALSKALAEIPSTSSS